MKTLRSVVDYWYNSVAPGVLRMPGRFSLRLDFSNQGILEFSRNDRDEFHFTLALAGTRGLREAASSFEALLERLAKALARLEPKGDPDGCTTQNGTS